MLITVKCNHSRIHWVCDKSDKMWFSHIKFIQNRLLMLKIKRTPAVAFCAKQRFYSKGQVSVVLKIVLQFLLLIFNTGIKWKRKKKKKVVIMWWLSRTNNTHKKKHLKTLRLNQNSEIVCWSSATINCIFCCLSSSLLEMVKTTRWIPVHCIFWSLFYCTHHILRIFLPCCLSHS